MGNFKAIQGEYDKLLKCIGSARLVLQKSKDVAINAQAAFDTLLERMEDLIFFTTNLSGVDRLFT